MNWNFHLKKRVTFFTARVQHMLLPIICNLKALVVHSEKSIFS